MNFLDYLINKGELNFDQRETLIEYLDLELKTLLTDLNKISKNRMEYLWQEYRHK